MIFDHPLYRAEPKEGTLRFDAEALKAGRTTREVLDSRCPSRAAVSQIAPRVWCRSQKDKQFRDTRIHIVRNWQTGTRISWECPMPRFYDTCAGPIRSLYLPPVAWNMLQREKIQTLEQLVDMADQLEQVNGMEPRMAEVIREALARVAPSEEPTIGEMLLAPWCA